MALVTSFRLRRDRQIRGQQRFFVDFDQERVFAGLGEGQIPDFVDQIDPVQGALRFERALEQRLRVRVVESHRDAQLVLARRAIRDREKPDHERMRDRKVTRLDVREDSENRVFAGTGVDMDPITRQPRQ